MTDFFWSDLLPHKCGSEEFCRAPKREEPRDFVFSHPLFAVKVATKNYLNFLYEMLSIAGCGTDWFIERVGC